MSQTSKRLRRLRKSKRRASRAERDLRVAHVQLQAMGQLLVEARLREQEREGTSSASSNLPQEEEPS